MLVIEIVLLALVIADRWASTRTKFKPVDKIGLSVLASSKRAIATVHNLERLAELEHRDAILSNLTQGVCCAEKSRWYRSSV